MVRGGGEEGGKRKKKKKEKKKKKRKNMATSNPPISGVTSKRGIIPWTHSNPGCLPGFWSMWRPSVLGCWKGREGERMKKGAKKNREKNKQIN